MANLVYFSGTMGSGKSTIALQTHHNHHTRGRVGVLYTSKDRAGSGKISSRLGMTADATEVDSEMDIYADVSARLGAEKRVDYLIADEVQFFSPAHIDQLALIVDLLHIDVFAFGITTDFRTRLFPATARLLELADEIITSPVPALCWCGEKGTHNARIVGGEVVTEGEQVLVGDINGGTEDVSYAVLCRRHHREGISTP